MGRKSVIEYNMLDGVTADMSGDFTSNTTNVLYLDYASIHLQWSGSGLTGEVFVDARNQEDADWYALDFGATIDITTDSGSHQIILSEMPFTEIRFRFVASAGTGTMTDGRLTAKVKGA
jgi:hypothetical protein